MSAIDRDDGQTTITQFTDPMCTWCWGSEPITRHLRVAYGDQIQINYVMGGLVEDFDQFYDATNDISEPSDAEPHWRETSELHGMPVNTDIFDEDPAESTYPASEAYVAVREQNSDVAHRYMRRLREAYFTQARNVNNREEQVRLAASLGVDVERFTAALDDGTAQTRFEEDLSRTRGAGVRSFPTYRINGPKGEQWARGFRPFEELVSSLTAVDPALEQSSPPPIQQFVADYGPVATQEVAELYDLNHGKTRQTLQYLVEDGSLRREPRGNGLLWHATGGGEY